MFKVDRCPEVSFSKVPEGAQTLTKRLDIFEMDITTPEKSNLEIKFKFTTNEDTNIIQETQNLFDALFQCSGRGPISADMFLQYWQALQFYQNTADSDHAWSRNGSQGSHPDILRKVQEYRDKVPRIYEWTEAKRMLWICTRDTPTELYEVAAGASPLENAIKAGQLVALLIYVANFPDDCEVNPLILLVICWTQGHLPPTDTFFFTLPPITRKYSSPPHNTGKPLAVGYCELNLSEGPIEIDGSASGIFLGSSTYPWIISTLFGVVISFFVSVASNSNPNLAACVGLLLLRPYSNDSCYIDAGTPPSWNGRRQIRWATNACGIFYWSNLPRTGYIGNSLPRACILAVVSWVAWYWDSSLRVKFSFGPRIPIALWVMWAAVVIQACMAFLTLLSVYVIAYLWKISYQIAMFNLLIGVWFSAVLVFMVRFLLYGTDLKMIYFLSEGLVFPTTIVVAQTFVGLGARNVYVQLFTLLGWSYMVAGSCFPYHV